MSKPARPARKSSPSKGSPKSDGFKKKAGPKKSSGAGSDKKKSYSSKPSKYVNPFGEKKKPQGGKKPFGKGGKKDFRKRQDENLELILSDRDAALVARIKQKLQEIREYKKILAEDGLKPDAEDKARESELIVTLLRMEKKAKMEARQRAKAARTEAFREAEEKAIFAKEKKKSRADRFSDDDDDRDSYRDRYEDSGDDDYSPRKRYDDDY